MKIHTVNVALHVSALTSSAIANHVQLVADQLAVLDELQPEIVSWDYGLDAGTGELEIGVEVSASFEADAISIAYAMIRSAIHAAGGRTPGWPGDVSQPLYEDAANTVPVFA